MRSLESTLRRIVVGYRAIATLWLLSLALVALRAAPERPSVIVFTMGAVVVWTSLTLWVSFRHPHLFHNPWLLATDIVFNAVLLLTPDLAGAPNFVGGYSSSAVMVAALGAGLPGGVAAVVVLVGVVLFQLGGSDSVGDPTVASSRVLVYPFIAAPVIWAVGALRRSDRLRAEAEAGLELERAERIRAEERTEMAAHLHDSVLQTLALIQRSSTDPDEVTALARGQERDLRSWLFNADTEAGSFQSALVEAAAAVEARHKVAVNVVSVGDQVMDDRLLAMVAASREAMVNAAKHSGAPAVSVYAEIESDRAIVFVRDRGIGFEAAEVPATRQGLAESITGRMRRHGGTANITSKPGNGTEIELTMQL